MKQQKAIEVALRIEVLDYYGMRRKGRMLYGKIYNTIWSMRGKFRVTQPNAKYVDLIVTLDNVDLRYPYERPRSHLEKDIHGKCTNTKINRMLSVFDENILFL